MGGVGLRLAVQTKEQIAEYVEGLETELRLLRRAYNAAVAGQADIIDEVAEGLNSGVRPAIMRFAMAMEAKLKKNDHKGGWENCTYEDLMLKLAGELEELVGVATPFGAMDETVDVANYAMMIFDNCAQEIDAIPEINMAPSVHRADKPERTVDDA